MYDDLLEANRNYATGFALAGIPARAAKGFALVTCMDSRIEPLSHARPASRATPRSCATPGGGSPSDSLRSLALAAHYLGVAGSPSCSTPTAR